MSKCRITWTFDKPRTSHPLFMLESRRVCVPCASKKTESPCNSYLVMITRSSSDGKNDSDRKYGMLNLVDSMKHVPVAPTLQLTIKETHYKGSISMLL